MKLYHHHHSYHDWGFSHVCVCVCACMRAFVRACTHHTAHKIIAVIHSLDIDSHNILSVVWTIRQPTRSLQILPTFTGPDRHNILSAIRTHWTAHKITAAIYTQQTQLARSLLLALFGPNSQGRCRSSHLDPTPEVAAGHHTWTQHPRLLQVITPGHSSRGHCRLSHLDTTPVVAAGHRTWTQLRLLHLAMIGLSWQNPCRASHSCTTRKIPAV